MKTLLVSINSKYVHSSLAVWYLFTASAKYSSSTSVLESTIKENKEKLAETISTSGCSVIAFSTYIWNINYIKELLPMLPKDLTIVLGGPEVSYNVKEVFDTINEVDIILSGEGEIPFYNMLDSLHTGKPLSGIKGLSTKEHISAPFITSEIPKSPYSEEYFTALKGRIVYFESSRGCPYSCSYCLSGRLCNVKFFDNDRVKSELDKLAFSGTKTIKFVDRTFNCNPKRAKEIIDFIIEKDYKDVCFHFEMAGDIITDEIIESFSKAKKGLFQIEVGVQSFNEFTLSSINRKTDISKIEKNMQKILYSANVHVHMDLIAGLPNEDITSFEIGFNRLFKLRPHMLQLGFLKLLHGSPIENENLGTFNKTAPYEITCGNWLTSEDLKSLKLTEDALDRLYNSGRFRLIIEEALKTEDNPYRLFKSFGEFSKTKYGTSIFDFYEKVLEFFSEIIPQKKLIDLMKEQWIKTNSSGKLPACIKNESMGALLKELDKNPLTKRKKAVKRAAVYLKTSEELIWVDYEHKDPVTGEYTIKGRN